MNDHHLVLLRTITVVLWIFILIGWISIYRLNRETAAINRQIEERRRLEQLVAKTKTGD